MSGRFFFFFFESEEEKQRRLEEEMRAIINNVYESMQKETSTQPSSEDKLLARLRKDVDKWHTHSHNGSVKHKWFRDYYPYKNHKKDATDEQWDTWHLIWDFKNENGRTEKDWKYRLSQGKAVELVKTTLLQTFGSDVSNICLVCLTASTRKKNDLRFKGFSEKVCKSLNIANGFTHITITRDGEAKHTGGTGQVEKEYDEAFFKDKYIVLFDDVRSSGSGIEKEKARLEAMGAHVICAITLGQTVKE